jgi:hypothetical protein
MDEDESWWKRDGMDRAKKKVIALVKIVLGRSPRSAVLLPPNVAPSYRCTFSSQERSRAFRYQGKGKTYFQSS